MTPNKSDSGELRKAIDKKLYRFADYIKHHERTGLGGPDNQGKILTELVDLVTAHIQAVGEEIAGKDYFTCSTYPDSSTRCNRCLHCRWYNDEGFCLGYEVKTDEVRQRLAQYLGEKDV